MPLSVATSVYAILNLKFAERAGTARHKGTKDTKPTSFEFFVP
jgi:hypothetical protein